MGDTYFSVVVTAIFLKPLSKVLGELGTASVRRSEGFKQLNRTKHMTLGGSCLAVTSSTVLYINLLMFFDGSHSIFHQDPWLNPLIFAGNLDIILNNIGMLFVCGIVKQALITVEKRRSTYKKSSGASAIKVAHDDNVDSQTYD